MISLDTNVIVRVVTADDPEQLAIALEVMRSEGLWLSKTALLEAERALRYTYKLSRETVLATFDRLLGYRNLSVEAPEQVQSALELCRGGMDFADALHLAASVEADRFVTFDRELARVPGVHTPRRHRVSRCRSPRPVDRPSRPGRDSRRTRQGGSQWVRRRAGACGHAMQTTP